MYLYMCVRMPDMTTQSTIIEVPDGVPLSEACTVACEYCMDIGGIAWAAHKLDVEIDPIKDQHE